MSEIHIDDVIDSTKAQLRNNDEIIYKPPFSPHKF